MRCSSRPTVCARSDNTVLKRASPVAGAEVPAIIITAVIVNTGWRVPRFYLHWATP